MQSERMSSLSFTSLVVESRTRYSYVWCLVLCCLENNLSVSYTGIFKLSVGVHPNVSSAEVPNQAEPDMGTAALPDGCRGPETDIRWSDVHQFLSSVFICMYGKFWVLTSQ